MNGDLNTVTFHGNIFTFRQPILRLRSHADNSAHGKLTQNTSEMYINVMKIAVHIGNTRWRVDKIDSKIRTCHVNVKHVVRCCSI